MNAMVLAARLAVVDRIEEEVAVVEVDCAVDPPRRARSPFLDLPASRLPAGTREGDTVALPDDLLPPSDVCARGALPHGAAEPAARRPDTTRAPALPGTP
jgi:hypothetical protein